MVHDVQEWNILQMCSVLVEFRIETRHPMGPEDKSDDLPSCASFNDIMSGGSAHSFRQ